jgi:hypothetical protein
LKNDRKENLSFRSSPGVREKIGVAAQTFTTYKRGNY